MISIKKQNSMGLGLDWISDTDYTAQLYMILGELLTMWKPRSLICKMVSIIM